MGAVFLIPFKIYIHSTSVYHKPRKFLVSCETEELSNTRQAKWMFKKRGGGWGMRTRRGRESGPKATSGYTRQLNTQQNFKTYKTNWSLFSFNQPCIFFFQPFENFYLKKKNTKHRLLSLQYVV